jgi:polyisoprenoid-binding protein YceI
MSSSPRPDEPARGGHWRWWLGIGLAVAFVVGVGGPFVYFHFVEGAAPAPLSLGSVSPAASPSAAASSGATNGSVDGTWNVTTGSVVGYRVNEVLFGQTHEAVGRTNAITGWMTVGGATVTAASFTVDMTRVTSDEDRRDEQFNGRIMEVSTYPTATFTLMEPIDLGSIPAEGKKRTLPATGDLTLHGVKKSVTFDVTGTNDGSAVQIAGSIPITFADWDISNPSFPPVVTTENHGVLEFALTFTHA